MILDFMNFHIGGWNVWNFVWKGTSLQYTGALYLSLDKIDFV